MYINASVVQSMAVLLVKSLLAWIGPAVNTPYKYSSTERHLVSGVADSSLRHCTQVASTQCKKVKSIHCTVDEHWVCNIDDLAAILRQWDVLFYFKIILCNLYTQHWKLLFVKLQDLQQWIKPLLFLLKYFLRVILFCWTMRSFPLEDQYVIVQKISFKAKLVVGLPEMSTRVDNPM